MDVDKCQENLRKAIIAISPVHENALNELRQFSIYKETGAKDFFCKAGDYSLYFAFVCSGIFKSYYCDIKGKEHCTGIFTQNMFMLPLPSFLYRKPAFQFFQAVTESVTINFKYADIENLSRKHLSVKHFLRTLIDREWILKKELMLAGKYIYDYRSRFTLFREQFKEHISQIPIDSISSYLNIPENQLRKLMDN